MHSLHLLRILLLAALAASLPLMAASKEPQSLDHEPVTLPPPTIALVFGATTSSVGVYQEGLVRLIPNEQGERFMPSLVTFTPSQTLVGKEAGAAAYLNPKNAIFNIRRLLGSSFEDVRPCLPMLPYEVVDINGKPHVKVDKLGEETLVTPEELTTMIMYKLKNQAESFLNATVSDAVITVPSDCSSGHLRAMLDAAASAGLRVVDVLEEAVAVDLAMSLYDDSYSPLLVLDIGASKLDVAVTATSSGGRRVLAQRSDTQLGGTDFDYNLMNYLLDQFQQSTGLDARNDKVAIHRLSQASEAVKVIMSTIHRTNVVIYNFYQGHDLRVPLTRAVLEDVNSRLFKRIITYIEEVIVSAGLHPSAIDEIVLVGGSASMPKIRQIISDFFGGKRIQPGLNSDEVPYGAVMHAGAIDRLSR